MKFIVILLGMMILYNSASAQPKTWKEKEDFHAIMSVTFHPSEDDNLKPLKDSATVLYTRARTWEKSEVPEGFNGKVIKPVLKRLVAECAAIEAAVKRNKPDAELKTMITRAHETFHEITEKCRE